MAEHYESGISRAKFVLTFYPVHIGQNFLSIQRRKYTLAFHPVTTHGSRRLVIETTDFALTPFSIAAHRERFALSVIPASFTLLTSRTNPLEPQPMGLRPMQNIPQEII